MKRSSGKAQQLGQSERLTHVSTSSVDLRDAASSVLPSAGESRQSPFRVAVFASGGGSNFQVLIDRVAAGELDVKLELLICDRPNARAIERAEQAGINCWVFHPKEYSSREAYEHEIVAELQRRGIDLIVMAGYMRLVTNVLVEPFYGRMINIHPALLPSFKGAHGITDALAYGAKVTGVTVHYVSLEMDAGPIIAQHAVPIQEDDTELSLATRLHAVEHMLLPEVVRWIREGRVQIVGSRTVIQ
jgi:phosphoribosylglycinamide formyltransferase-1